MRKGEKVEEYVIRGPPMPEIPVTSFAEYILPKLKSLPKDLVVLVNGETGETLTAGQFLANSIQITYGLKGLGVKATDIAANFVRNSFEANEIILGCWLGSIAVAPVNAMMKIPEMKHCLSLLKPKVIFCEECIVSNVMAAVEILKTTPIIILTDTSKKTTYTYLKLEDLKEECDVENFSPQPIKDPSSEVILIMPSSGTSGFPKEIGITHSNLIYQDKVMDRVGWFGSDRTFLQVSQFFWITGIIGLLRGISVGAKRIFVKNINPMTIFRAIDLYKASFSIMAPLSWLGLSKCPQSKEYDLSSLKYVIVAGSPLTSSILKSIKRENPNLKIYEIYGLTETSGMLTSSEDEDGSVGKLCLGASIKIIDTKTGESLKANTTGEILAKCPGLMKGYIGNEKETKETIDEDGWIHTGDIGYYDEYEKLYVVDRIKEMIKVRNFQVAPAEVENVIGTIPGVVEVGVIGIPCETDGSSVVAFVVRHKGSKVTEKDVYSVVENSLSDYKHLKGGVFFIETMPKTETGKVNRNQLREMAKTLTSNSG